MKCIPYLLAVALLLTGCTFTAVPPVITEPVTEPAPWTMPKSPYTPKDFVEEGDYLTCTAGTVAMGIDVSSHQGEIDWPKVAEAGVKYAFVRVGYRGYGNGALMEDTRVQANLQGAKNAGILVGAYFFSQAVNVEEAREEAEFAMEILGPIGVKLDMPLVYDWEYVSETARTANVDRETLTECTLAFCEAVKQQGYDPMIYFNTSQGWKLLDLERLEQYPWWLAKYDLDAAFLCQVDLWQYTNQGTVPGISGKVDIDLMFTEYGLGRQVFGASA